MEFSITVTLFLKLWDVTITTVPVPLRDTNIEKGVKKRQQDEMRRDYIQQKGYQILEMWECEWWSLHKTDASVKSNLRENFPYRSLQASFE